MLNNASFDEFFLTFICVFGKPISWQDFLREQDTDDNSNVFGGHMSFFGGPLVPLFWISGDNSNVINYIELKLNSIIFKSLILFLQFLQAWGVPVFNDRTSHQGWRVSTAINMNVL